LQVFWGVKKEGDFLRKQRVFCLQEEWIFIYNIQEKGGLSREKVTEKNTAKVLPLLPFVDE